MNDEKSTRINTNYSITERRKESDIPLTAKLWFWFVMAAILLVVGGYEAIFEATALMDETRKW